MKVIAIAALVSTAAAFADTAAFYSSQPLEFSHSRYITKSADLSDSFEKLTSDFCSKNSDGRLTVYRVGHLSRDAPSTSNSDGTFLQHVHYSTGSELDLSIADECSVAYLDKVPETTSELHANVVVIDIDDGMEHNVAEYLTGGNVVVQGKPGFQTTGSRGESIKEFIGEKLHFDLDAPVKREVDDSVDSELAESFTKEVETDFEIAESFIEAQESDAFVKELSDDSAFAESSGSGKNTTTKRSNLFTNYQFFTPGVWSVLIVCFFLVYVSVTAVSWITSIDLSYRSFEKQIEFEKKTE